MRFLTEPQVEGLRQTVKKTSRSGQQLQRETHTLKGTSATLGAQAISALCGHLDRDACTAESDYAGSLIGSIESGFERVHRQLTAELCEATA